MCLIINKSEWRHLLGFPRKAREDIKCYKVLRDIGDGLFVTPYRYAIAKVKKGEYLEADWFEYTSEGEVNHAIHTFRRPVNVTGTEILVPCVIPKGTNYWISNDNKEYASERIKFLEDYVQ